MYCGLAGCASSEVSVHEVFKRPLSKATLKCYTRNTSATVNIPGKPRRRGYHVETLLGRTIS